MLSSCVDTVRLISHETKQTTSATKPDLALKESYITANGSYECLCSKAYEIKLKRYILYDTR